MKNGLFMAGVFALALAFTMTVVGCDDGSTETQPQTVKYVSTDGAGTTYTLTITGKDGSGVYTPQTGDSYVLEIKYANGTTKKSSGTVSAVGADGGLTLLPSGAAEPFTVILTGGNMTGMLGTITIDGGGTVSAPTALTPVVDNNNSGSFPPFTLTDIQAKGGGGNSTLTKDFLYTSFDDNETIRLSDLIENPSVRLVNGKVSLSFDKPKNWNPQSGNLFWFMLIFRENSNGGALLGYGRRGIFSTPGGSVSLIYSETAKTLTQNNMPEEFATMVYDTFTTANVNVSLQPGWNYMVVSYEDLETVTITSGEPSNEFEWFVYSYD